MSGLREAEVKLTNTRIELPSATELPGSEKALAPICRPGRIPSQRIRKERCTSIIVSCFSLSLSSRHRRAVEEQ